MEDRDEMLKIKEKGIIQDSAGRTLKLNPSVELPFVFQLQDLDSANLPPSFDQTEIKLVKEL